MISPNNADRYQEFISGSMARIKIDTKITPSGALLIKYRKPDGTTGSWTATADGTYLYYDPAATTTINVPGYWFLWAHIVESGTVKIGKVVILNVLREGAL